MKKEKVYKINIDDLIALCHIKDKFEDFNTQLFILLSAQGSKELIYKLGKIAQGKLIWGNLRLKNFYKINKETINCINQYSNIVAFILLNYNTKGKINKTYNIYYFYQYLLRNEENIEHILQVLEKLKELGFKEIQLGETIDFTKEEYIVNKLFNYNYDIIYLENREVIPNYDYEKVKYRTSASHYKMTIKTSFHKLSEYNRTILLNTLIFDLKTLPENINKELIFDYLLMQKEEQQENIESLKNTVRLNVAIKDLENQMHATLRVIDELDNLNEKEDLLKLLSEIKEKIEELNKIGKENEENLQKRYLLSIHKQ